MRKGPVWGIPRLATHGWALALALLVLAGAPLAMRHPIAEVHAGDSGAHALASLRAVGFAGAETRSTSVRRGDLPPLIHYRVRAGDTIDAIAAQTELTIDTLVQVNHLQSSAVLVAGQTLVVPPTDGTMISVDPSQTLDQIAARFRMDASTLRTVNSLRPDQPLPPELFIPAMSTDAAVTPIAAADQGGVRQRVIRFAWPTTGVITQYFWTFHPGIDIANEVGTPEVAADNGKVIFAGWGAYGIYVELDHGNGFHTIYAHMSKALVSTGQVVSKGQAIGLMGMTGRATGPHLHFEIRYQGVPQNPLDLLN